MKDTTKALLIFTDSYSISVTEHDSVAEATQAMQEHYNQLCPSELEEEYADLSYCSDEEAILYDNGDTVYVWKVYET